MMRPIFFKCFIPSTKLFQCFLFWSSCKSEERQIRCPSSFFHLLIKISISIILNTISRICIYFRTCQTSSNITGITAALRRMCFINNNCICPIFNISNFINNPGKLMYCRNNNISSRFNSLSQLLRVILNLLNKILFLFNSFNLIL